jgi:hypothetical protein
VIRARRLEPGECLGEIDNAASGCEIEHAERAGYSKTLVAGDCYPLRGRPSARDPPRPQWLARLPPAPHRPKPPSSDRYCRDADWAALPARAE